MTLIFTAVDDFQANPNLASGEHPSAPASDFARVESAAKKCATAYSAIAII
jgi:hypothetical protein